MSLDFEKIRQVIAPVLEEQGCEWVDGQFVFESGRKILRLLIDKKTEGSGVTLGDCQAVSREVGVLLDVEGVVPDRYVLEVSSPGIRRPLNGEKDFLRFVGRTVSVRTREPIDGRRNYKGVLTSCERGEVDLLVDNQQFRIPVARIEKARLEESLSKE